MEQKHYIVQVKNMWVGTCWMNIGVIKLTINKTEASQLTFEQLEWIKEMLPDVNVIEVKITIEETFMKL